MKLLTALESQFGKAQFIVTSGDNAYWNGNVDQLELGTFGLSMRTSLCTFDKIRQYSCVFVRREQYGFRDCLTEPSLLSCSGVGRYFAHWMTDPGDGDDTHRFFPTLGNHGNSE